MLLYYQSWMFYNHFISFLVLTYWHSAKCQLLFSACFLHRRKSIWDGVQMQQNFTEIFLDQKEHNGPWLRLGVLRGEHNPPGRPRRPRRAPTLVYSRWVPSGWFFHQYFFIYSKNILRKVSGHSEKFYFCTKITPWQFCWKQRQSGLVPFKSCKLESKTRAKVFGKVNMTETYQLPQA